MHNRRYVKGLLAGGFLGAMVGVAYLLSKHEPSRKLLRRPEKQIKGSAERVWRGVAAGVSEMLQR